MTQIQFYSGCVRTAVIVFFVTAALLIATSIELSAADVTRTVRISWDFGSGPGKNTNFYVGERTIDARYSSEECITRFSLETVSYEFALVEKDGKYVQEGPPFVMFAFQKHFAGDFGLLPQITIMQNEADAKGNPTGRKMEVVFPFRDKEMAVPVDDWTAKDVEIRIGAPGAIMELHNPFDWSDIIIKCD